MTRYKDSSRAKDAYQALCLGCILPHCVEDTYKAVRWRDPAEQYTDKEVRQIIRNHKWMYCLVELARWYGIERVQKARQQVEPEQRGELIRLVSQ